VFHRAVVPGARRRDARGGRAAHRVREARRRRAVGAVAARPGAPLSARAVWSPDQVGLALDCLVVDRLVPAGPLTVVV